MHRPNAKTLGELEARKQQVYGRSTVPKGSISVHIRRGDKWRESANTDDAVYARAAEALYEAGAQTFGLTRNIFLSTEDPAAVAYFRRLQGWNVSFTHVPRKPDAHKSTVEYTKEIGAANEMLNSLVSNAPLPDCMAIHLECALWYHCWPVQEVVFACMAAVQACWLLLT